MKKVYRILTSILAMNMILLLAGCTSESTNVGDWRWWNYLLAFFIIVLVVLTILLVDTLVRGKKANANQSAEKIVEVEKVIYKELPATFGENKLEDEINKVTEEVLNKSAYAMNASYTDCKIPASENLEYSLIDIDRYITNKINIIKTEASGKKPTSYKIRGKKSFALLIDLGEGKFKITLKCGPAYGARLKEYFKDVVTQSKFPYGFLWFTVSNEVDQPSLELIKQMVDISYELAKIGY